MLIKIASWEETAENKWDQQAVQWDKRSMQMWDHGSRKDIIPFMNKHLENGSKVIDVGCGSGYGTYKLHETGYDVTGIDISEKMIALAKARFINETVSFYQSDINNLSIRDETYDSAMVINVLEWTSNPFQGLTELNRVLKYGGFLCVGILGPTAGPRAHSYRQVYGEEVILNTMMPWEFTQMALENGFILVDHYGVYKREVNESHISDLPLKLKQALSFMWVFMLKKQER